MHTGRRQLISHLLEAEKGTKERKSKNYRVLDLLPDDVERILRRAHATSSKTSSKTNPDLEGLDFLPNPRIRSQESCETTTRSLVRRSDASPCFGCAEEVVGRGPGRLVAAGPWTVDSVHENQSTHLRGGPGAPRWRTWSSSSRIAGIRVSQPQNPRRRARDSMAAFTSTTTAAAASPTPCRPAALVARSSAAPLRSAAPVVVAAGLRRAAAPSRRGATLRVSPPRASFGLLVGLPCFDAAFRSDFAASSTSCCCGDLAWIDFR